MRKQAREFSEEALKAVLVPLGPYLDQLVVSGSWVPFIYRRWLLKQKPGAKGTVRTLDVDLAVRENLAVVGQPLAEQLRQAGYRITRWPQRSLWGDEGGDEPQVTHFELRNAPYLELITPRKGRHRPGTVREVQNGVGACELDYVEILLEDARDVPIPETPLRVRVPTLAAYVYQKGLTFPMRQDRAKKEKDLANLFDVLQNFPELHGELLGSMPALGRRHGKAAWSAFRANLTTAFNSAEGEGVRLIETQQPDPYRDLVQGDPANGSARFRELVYARFKEFLEKVGV
ncbi:MAG TPA: GSU2403 family nucleotidyltransferase fold protein [Planctomycetota bacterium]|nr:GSU2403 family nucleotidyltransferase fold protein [Planctomycetota bacterium]